MSESGVPANPFVAASAAPPAQVDDSRARPFSRGGGSFQGGGGANLSKTLRRKVKDLGQEARVSVQPTERAGDLSVKDLNDLAAEFSGVASNNPNVAALTIEDLNSIEAVFFDVKMNAAKTAREASASGAPVDGAPIFDNWSCCCCTPCCSCAASDPDPFES